MAARTRTMRSWHRQVVVVASLAALAAVGWIAYRLLDGSTDDAEARLLTGDTVTAGVTAQPTEAGGSGLRLCNRTGSRVGVAIGYKADREWTTEGWWNVAGGSCETLVPGPLVSRFYYIYAVDYDDGGVWGGKAAMCTRDKMFTIRGIENCVARGFERSGFFEVDTGEQKSWTVQLTAPGTAATGG